MRRATLLLVAAASAVLVFFTGVLVGAQGGGPVALEAGGRAAPQAAAAAGGAGRQPRPRRAPPPSPAEQAGCQRAYASRSSRPGRPCLPPAAFYPFGELVRWRLELGERVALAAAPSLTEDECDGFALHSQSTWCMRAMGPVPGAVGLSYGVGRRDPWSEQLSNLFGVPSRLFGCLAEGGPALLDGVTRNGALSCRGQKGICYEKPYTLFAAACPAGGGGGQRERFLQHLRDQAPLSAHVKMNVEDAEWDLLRGLLGSGEDFEKVRTLDLTVHLSAASAGRQDLEDRVTVLERLAQRFSVVGSTLEYQRELWSPEARCPGSDCPEPAVHLPSMAVDGLSVSLVNRRLVARWRAPSGHRRHAPDVPPTSPPGAEQFVSRVEKPCQRVLGGKSSRPGVPCLPPAQAYPYKSWTRWRLDLGERVAVAVTPTITEAQCGGFSFYGDSTLCNAAMGKAGALALSYGIEERDLWSERMSNIYHLRTKLYDCFIPPARSPPMAGVAPNATGPCQLEGSHCYEQPYEPYRVCLGPEAGEHRGREYETMSSHLQGRSRLSTHVKVDVEGYEWPVFEQLLASEEDMAKIRTLEFEVHFSYILQFGEKQLPEREMLEKRVSVMERLLDRFACTGSTLEVYREDWNPEKDCGHGGCGEPALHIPSMSVDQFAVSYVNRDLLLPDAGSSAGGAAAAGAPAGPTAALPDAWPAGGSAEGPCSPRVHDLSARPGVPCLPPAASYPFRERTPWRLALGERIVAAVTPHVSEEACQGFQLFGDSVWCLRAMGTKDVPDPLGLSYGIEQRDLWSEKLSNVFRVPTRLYDCFVPPRDSPPMAGTAPNASGPCDPSGPHCYETPYRAFRECLGPRAGVVEGRTVATLGSHLEGRGPLSTWLKIDVEGSEWSALEQLLESEEGMARVRTLEMEVHFSYAPFVDREAFLQLPEQERLERRVRVMERLLKNFACVGSNLEVYREQWHPETECPGSSCDEPQVHVASMSVDQFAVSYVNRALLPRGE